MLSTSAENTIKAVNTKTNTHVHLFFKGTKGRVPIMNVVQMLDPRTILDNTSKTLVEEWA